jgi:hypothetical protein
MNTGAWTELPAFYLQMTGKEMTLKKSTIPVTPDKTSFLALL